MDGKAHSRMDEKMRAVSTSAIIAMIVAQKW